jgi:hypothetical protein
MIGRSVVAEPIESWSVNRRLTIVGNINSKNNSRLRIETNKFFFNKDRTYVCNIYYYGIKNINEQN